MDVFKPQPKQKTGDKFVVLYSGGFSIAYDFDQIFNAAKIIEKYRLLMLSLLFREKVSF